MAKRLMAGEDVVSYFQSVVEQMTTRTEAKSVLASDLHNFGGLLDMDSQKEFVRVMRGQEENALFNAATYQDMTGNPRMRVEKVFLTRPFLKKRIDNGDLVNFGGNFMFGSPYELDVVRMEGADYVGKQVLRRNMERESLQETIITMGSQKGAMDMQFLGVRGDTTKSGSDAVSELIKSNDGWSKLLRRAIQNPARGNQISQELFVSSYKKLPSRVRRLGSRWMCHSHLMLAYQQELAKRIGDAATAMLFAQNPPKPLNIDWMLCDDFDTAIPVPIKTATKARVIGYQIGPAKLSSSHYAVKIDVDNQGSGTGRTVDLRTAFMFGETEGLLEYAVIASAINATFKSAWGSDYDSVASVTIDGFFMLESKLSGATAEIDVQAVSNDLYAELGLTAAVTTGAAEGNNTITSGTELWFGPPANLVWGSMPTVEVYFRHIPERDRYNLVLFLEADFQIASPEGTVVTPDIYLPM